MDDWGECHFLLTPLRAAGAATVTGADAFAPFADVEDSPAASSGASTPAPAPASAAPKAPAARSRWQDEDKSDEEEVSLACVISRSHTVQRLMRDVT